MRTRRQAMLLLGLATVGSAVWAAPGEAAEPYRVVLEDPERDDHGPGSYVYPSGSWYARGTFDLRKVEIERVKDAVEFRITFGTRVVWPHQVRRTHARTIDLENGLYLQNVDIYIDTDGSPATGYTEALPGRYVDLDGATPWDRAVVVTPQPFLTRSILSGWRPLDAVTLATNVTSLGPTVTARVPIDRIGEPTKAWGFAIMVSGAVWEQSFDAVNRLVGRYKTNALTMPVSTVPEDQIFGGGELTFFHPWVIDIITPPGQSQSRILSSFDVKRERLAKVPMVYPFPEARAKLAPPLPRIGAPKAPVPKPTRPGGAIVVTVKDVDGELVVLTLPEGEASSIKPYTLGTVLDREQQPVARVVVSAIYPKFILATAVEGADKIKVGAAVQFAPSKE